MQLGLSKEEVGQSSSFTGVVTVLHAWFDFLELKCIESEPEFVREEVAHVDAARLVGVHRDHLELFPLRLLCLRRRRRGVPEGRHVRRLRGGRRAIVRFARRRRISGGQGRVTQ